MKAGLSTTFQRQERLCGGTVLGNPSGDSPRYIGQTIMLISGKRVERR
jgi:hypothetical protein